jgi:hypothetical protein
MNFVIKDMILVNLGVKILIMAKIWLLRDGCEPGSLVAIGFSRMGLGIFGLY